MIIREYTELDKVQILLLHDEFMSEFFPDFYTDGTLLEEGDLEEKHSYWVYQSGKFWVMEDQGIIVGYIGVQLQIDHRADLIQLRVKKSHRRRGIATLLIKKVEKYARSQGKEKMYLHTAIHLNNARKLYEKCGYTLIRSTKPSPHLNFTVIQYMKDLLAEKEK